MVERERERQIDARHLAQDLALEGADDRAIRRALRERQLDDCLNDEEIAHIVSEYAVVEDFEFTQENRSPHYLVRSFGVAVMLGGCVVWYLFGFDFIPVGAIVFGLLLALAPDKAFSDVFSDLF